MPRTLFFAGMLDAIEPATDDASLAIAARMDEGIARTMLLKQLALAQLPRTTIRIEIARHYNWTISFGPQGSIAHSLDGLELGVDDAHGSLPILRLAEVRAIARGCSGGDVPAAYVPLLLYPIAGMTDAEVAFAHDDVRASRVDVAIDLVINAIDAGPRSTWRRDPKFGWITDAEDSYRNPYGVHYGSAWRELGDDEQAEAIAADAWRADREFAYLASFFAELGCDDDRR